MKGLPKALLKLTSSQQPQPRAASEAPTELLSMGKGLPVAPGAVESEFEEESSSAGAEGEQTLPLILRILHSWMFLSELIPCVQFHTAAHSEQVEWLHALIRKVNKRRQLPARGTGTFSVAQVW